MLEKGVLEEFISVVGINNVSDDIAICESYSYNWCTELFNPPKEGIPNPFSVNPVAIILPGSTEEVSKVVKLCISHNLKFKPQSTGFGAWNQVTEDNVVVIDLKRMNRIVEINPDSLFVIVEPYVSGAQLQSELIKYGLNCHMPGAGPQVSPLASTTSMGGPGFTSASTGHSARNALGIEWVLPTGEIVHIGSPSMKNNPSWFCGDGPGPSLRGITRGYIGALGGLCIFTKVAVKLYPFPTKPMWKVKGQMPLYDFEVPDFMKINVIDYPDYDSLEIAFRAFEESEITFACFHHCAFATGIVFSHYKTMLKKMPPALFFKNPLFVIIASRFASEYTYKKKVMEKIIKDTGGKTISDKRFTKIPNISYAEFLRSLFGFHAFLVGTSFQSTHGSAEAIGMVAKMMEKNIPLKKQYIKSKMLANDRGKGTWATSFEHGHYYHAEMPSMFDSGDIDSVEGMKEYLDKCNRLDLTEHLGVPFFIVGDKSHEQFGPECSDYHIWLRKIKESFDPQNHSDPGFYISSQKET